jgi:hypothetical protein
MKERKTSEDIVGKKVVEKSKAAVEAPTTKKEDQVEIALAAKAKLYDQILAGKAKLSSDLVNFDDKVSEGYVVPPQREVIAATLPPRPPSMPKPANVNLAVSSAQPSVGANSSSSAASKAAASDVSTAPHYNWSTTYQSSATKPTARSSEGNGTSSTYSREESSYAGEYGGRDYNSEYLREADQQRQLRRAVEEKIHAEAEVHDKSAARSVAYNPYTGRSGDADEEGSTARVSEAARVKTQWEKTLNSSARSFLEDIHTDTNRQREHSAEGFLGHIGSGGANSCGASTGAESGLKRSAKEERLEMIRQKRSKSGLC